jgi:hypothetical protein
METQVKEELKENILEGFSFLRKNNTRISRQDTHLGVLSLKINTHGEEVGGFRLPLEIHDIEELETFRIAFSTHEQGVVYVLINPRNKGLHTMLAKRNSVKYSKQFYPELYRHLAGKIITTKNGGTRKMFSYKEISRTKDEILLKIFGVK